jgi:hypothetical protein
MSRAERLTERLDRIQDTTNTCDAATRMLKRSANNAADAKDMMQRADGWYRARVALFPLRQRPPYRLPLTGR